MRITIELTESEVRTIVREALGTQGYHVTRDEWIHDRNDPNGSYRVSGYKTVVDNLAVPKALGPGDVVDATLVDEHGGEVAE
jgi:ABC-type oligopeptide transport system substrate-binding subunit